MSEEDAYLSVGLSAYALIPGLPKIFQYSRSAVGLVNDLASSLKSTPKKEKEK